MNLEGLAPFGFNPIHPDYEPHDMCIQIESAVPVAYKTNCRNENNLNKEAIGDCQAAAALDLSVQKSAEIPVEEPIEETIDVADETNIQESTIQGLKQEIAQLKETCQILQEQLQVFANNHTCDKQPETEHHDTDDPIQIWKVQWRSGFTVPIDTIPKRSFERPSYKWPLRYHFPILSYFRSSL